MQNFFKEVKDNGTIQEVCEILKSTKPSGPVTALHQVAAEALSTLICPVYGDFYSFPWKRGPHDNILEYTEASAIFEGVRDVAYTNLKDFDFTSKFIAIYNSEEESKFVEVKCSVLRFFSQLLRTFDVASCQSRKMQESPLDTFLSNPHLKNLLVTAAFSSKNTIIQGCAIQVLTLILRQILVDQSLDSNVLVLDVQKVYLLFEKNFKTEPMLSILCCGLLNEMLHQDPQQAAFINQKFCQANTLTLLRDLIDLKLTKKGTITLVEGINFGCPYEGYFDHPIIFF
mmetsp:Transcript_29412/g.44502  ORF Transcript_29412/g.44502 Transcript_29412/m.44502 type:complete len:285 (-) Transcript_29412:1335-2189(-)|eukprot:CAMPEP_0170483762 /NCGR_PEP_ID=MMETSP0208-20121228/3383_1 /TAXON_ID=197538 /ORGANISM="Strombidium inclinatum, Strain S3" /LENGTH=284 /DNA_ID=CAMNT_0010756919 /DNA_START=1478 /DNA_END=2332 /DNA_ORIENTATION=+